MAHRRPRSGAVVALWGADYAHAETIKTHREVTMRSCLLWLMAASVAGVLVAGPAAAQTGAALAGQVTSAEEGAMEGVLVSAKKGIVTITVATDKDGRYSFP